MGLAAPQHVGSSQTRAQTRVPCIGRRILNHCATREAPPIRFFFFFAGRGWTLHWVFVAVLGLSLVAVSGGYSSLRWLLLLRSTGSRRTGFSSCSMWAQLLRGMWDVPGPGTEPVSPTLAGGFSFIFNYLII